MRIQAIPGTYLSQINSVKPAAGQGGSSAGYAIPVSGARQGDRVELSAAGVEKFLSRPDSQAVSQSGGEGEIPIPASDESNNNSAQELSGDEQTAVKELKSRDREVRMHEQAHLAVAGGYATSGARFTFEVGPDGKRYATGGEVSIDTSAVADDPAATIRKMQTVRKAAQAPMNPSAADRAIAAEAGAAAAQARAELMQKNNEINTPEATNQNQIPPPAVDEQSYQLKSGISAYENAAYAVLS